ncbi:MAG: DNA-3-methyladenine glycosylase I [Bryobacterales bacterium]|nr:DNA-3-methyladenine glycosylase I [Bryobacterales bacterium]
MGAAERIFIGADGKARCSWCKASAEYIRYHDTEWGFPVMEDRRLFEKISLEGFQAGLSWLTILNKREAFREVFAGFDYHVVARFGSREVERLLSDARIVRHRGKIETTIGNARLACELESEFGSLRAYFWGFQPREANVLSKDLKRRGWRFVGPATVHAFMQAMGLVNDHAEGCFVRAEVEEARRALEESPR